MVEHPVIVMKFGGTSVGSPEGRAAIGSRVTEALELGKAPVVVVSAMGRKGAPYATDTLLSLVAGLPTDERERDLLASTGEIISAVVVAHELRAAGIDACAFTGGEAGIGTDGVHENSAVTEIYPTPLLEAIVVGRVPVVAGFQGIADDGSVTTLGRGGSDTTACALGVALSAEAVEIYSRFQTNFTKVLWITNPSNISLITSLIARKGINVPPGSCYFPVVGEYFSETFRESVAGRYGHAAREPFVVWTGYGSADTGDIAVETAATIRLRKFFHKSKELRRQLFDSDDTPMLLALAPKAHVEILDGRIVVTKDQLVPLVRYNTGDEGGILEKEELGRGGAVPEDILNELPERMLFVRGRASDSIIFYGTNLNVQEINQHFLGLPREMSYSGLYTVRKVEQGDVTLFEFTVFVESLGDGALAERYHASLLGYLKGRSLEFEAKYSNLTRSLGEELIRVEVEELAGSTGAIKHRFIIE